jgi:hypothetical protein
VVRHVALFRWKPETTAADVSKLEQELHALPTRIACIQSYRFGRDLGLQEGNADFAIVADFIDAAGLEEYANHPDHLAVLNGRIRPMLAHREAIQYVIDHTD